MRCEYTAAGPNAFAVMRSVAYGLHQATVEEITYHGDPVPWPYDEVLPTGTGRDERLHRMAEELHRTAGAPQDCWTGDAWKLRGHFSFDGTEREKRWLVDYARPHARSFQTRLLIPAIDEQAP